MVPFRTAMACCAVALFSSSCAGVKRYTRLEKVRFTLRLWIEDHPSLSKEDALKGCAEWLPKGVRCALAESVREADVRVSADMSACLPDKEGIRTLALAHKGGDITFLMQCFKNPDGTYDRHQYRAVMAHEIGHETGIWEHVPETCDGKDGTPPVRFDGKKVCGQAVMNRFYEKEVWFVTEIDSSAFDMRNIDYSVIVPVGSDATATQPLPPQPKPAGPDCTFYGR